jgi:hypothetical protein
MRVTFVRLVMMRVGARYGNRIRVRKGAHVTDEGENCHSDQQPWDNAAVQDGEP